MRWLLFGLLLLPVGAAQIVAVEADIVQPVDFGLGVAEDQDSGEFCSNQNLVATNTSLAFAENEYATGCALYTVEMTPPARSGHFRVEFVADRTVEDSAGGAVPIRAAQEIRIESSERSGRLDIFDPDKGTMPPTDYVTPFFEGGGHIVLGWYFADDAGQGAAGLNLGGGHAYAASIRDAHVFFPNVQLTPPSDGTTLILPEDVANTATEVRVTLAPGTKVTRIAADGFTVQAAVEGRTVVLDGAALAQYGQRFVFDVAIQPTPTSIAPLHWIPPFLVPLIGVAAVARSWTYYQGTRLIYRRTARYVLIIATIGLLYALAISIVAPLLQGAELAIFPLSAMAAATYVQWLVLASAFVAIILLASRSQLVAVQDDLHRRERQREELLRSNRELEHFASVASHDLQEPLRKVAGFTALLAEDPDGAEAKAYARYAHDGATRMQRMVQDLLRYSRMGQQEIERLPIDMDELIDEVALDLGTLLEEAGATVEHRDLPQVMGAASLVRQLLSNLIQNAVKYRHPQRAPRIRISGHQWPFETQIVVADNGRGIPKGQEEKVFQLFRRVHEDQPGTGIGLALCARIVALHGGRIWVESDDKGSRFHFTIPRDT